LARIFEGELGDREEKVSWSLYVITSPSFWQDPDMNYSYFGVEETLLVPLECLPGVGRCSDSKMSFFR
jgi:hypothetical protein